MNIPGFARRHLPIQSRGLSTPATQQPGRLVRVDRELVS